MLRVIADNKANYDQVNQADLLWMDYIRGGGTNKKYATIEEFRVYTQELLSHVSNGRMRKAGQQLVEKFADAIDNFDKLMNEIGPQPSFGPYTRKNDRYPRSLSQAYTARLNNITGIRFPAYSRMDRVEWLTKLWSIGSSAEYKKSLKDDVKICNTLRAAAEDQLSYRCELFFSQRPDDHKPTAHASPLTQ